MYVRQFPQIDHLLTLLDGDGYYVPPQKAQRPSTATSGVRRLPPTPSSPSSSISMMPMPEPDPYDSGAPSPRPSVESYSTGGSSDLLRQATTGSMRRLPSAPGRAAPRPPARNSDSSHYGGMSRATSYRPPGAGAPVRPGSPAFDPYESYQNGHQPLAESQQYKLTPACEYQSFFL
jgi:hypothetical protein